MLKPTIYIPSRVLSLLGPLPFPPLSQKDNLRLSRADRGQDGQPGVCDWLAPVSSTGRCGFALLRAV